MHDMDVAGLEPASPNITIARERYFTTINYTSQQLYLTNEATNVGVFINRELLTVEVCLYY